MALCAEKNDKKASEPDSFTELRAMHRELGLKDLKPLAFVSAPGSDTQVGS